MILIRYEENKITIKGHANYSDSLDIVCASCSSIMYTTVNAILRFNEKAIKKGDTVVISTSGNIGIAIAYFGKEL